MAFDVVIGLVFIYLLYSLLGTLLQEIIATNIGLRGWILERAIRRMLDDDGQPENHKPSDAFYAHPLIKYLAADTLFLKKKPSYITKETFSKVVIDLLRGDTAKPGDSFRKEIQHSLSSKKLAWAPTAVIASDTLQYLNSMWADAQGDVDKFKGYLEQWFTEMMDRATGWYKKYTQLILLFVGLAIALVFNADTIKIINRLQTDPKLREKVIAQASEFTKAHPSLDVGQLPAKADTSTNAEKQLSNKLISQASKLANQDLGKVNNLVGLGWPDGFCRNFDKAHTDGTNLIFRIFICLTGWLLTALAVSLGAPFWFDLLNKLMQLRSSVQAQDDSSGSDATTVKTIERVG